MLILKIKRVLKTETISNKTDSTKHFRLYRLLINNPFFENDTVHPGVKILTAMARENLDLPDNREDFFVYVSIRYGKNGQQTFINGMAS